MLKCFALDSLSQTYSFNLDLNQSGQHHLLATAIGSNTSQPISGYDDIASLYGTGSSSINGTEPTDELVTSPVVDDSVLRHYITFVKSVIVPVICSFGILGNALALVILTRKKLKSTCDGSERTVHLGLFSLSISDFLFCLCLLPHGLIASDLFDSDKKDFTIIYRTYGDALINTFILTSTWCTVNMAASRYLAIVRPFKTRAFISPTGTKVSTLLVFVVCIVFNIPRFFENEISEIDCPNGTKMYFIYDGYLRQHQRLRLAYMWLYFIIGIFLPLAALAFCNFRLVKALIDSTRTRQESMVPSSHVKSNRRIMSILVAIVVMYIVLVSPAEILLFALERLKDSVGSAPHPLVMAVELTNVLQTLNFSCNFIMYFILNVQFRVALKEMCCDRCTRHLHKHDKDRYRFQPISNQKSDVSKLNETSQTKV